MPCLLWGCGAALLATVLIALVSWWYIQRAVDTTFPRQATVPVAEVSADERTKLSERVRHIRQTARRGKAIQFSLSIDDINALIATEPDAAALRGLVYLEGDGNAIRARMNIPMSTFDSKVYSDRYLDVTAQLVAENRTGELDLYFDNLQFGGFQVPASIREKLEGQGLLEHIRAENAGDDRLQRIRIVRVDDGNVTVHIAAD
jgi:hypothetical protein